MLARKRTGDVDLQRIPAIHDGTLKYNGWGNSRSFFLFAGLRAPGWTIACSFCGIIRLEQPSRRDCARSHHSIRQVRDWRWSSGSCSLLQGHTPALGPAPCRKRGCYHRGNAETESERERGGDEGDGHYESYRLKQRMWRCYYRNVYSGI